MDMIKVLAKAPNSEAFKERIKESVDVLRGYVEQVRKKDVDARDLIISKRLSMHPNRYTHDFFQAIAARQLMKEGVEITGGQTVRYLITDAENKRASKRVKAAELINVETQYDAQKYMDMLILTGANILSPFGYTEKTLKDNIVYGEKQIVLESALRTA